MPPSSWAKSPSLLGKDLRRLPQECLLPGACWYTRKLHCGHSQTDCRFLDFCPAGRMPSAEHFSVFRSCDAGGASRKCSQAVGLRPAYTVLEIWGSMHLDHENAQTSPQTASKPKSSRQVLSPPNVKGPSRNARAVKRINNIEQLLLYRSHRGLVCFLCATGLRTTSLNSSFQADVRFCPNRVIKLDHSGPYSAES